MVVGKTSSFIEGFENITVDKNLLLQNLSSTLDLLAANKNVPSSQNMNMSALSSMIPPNNMSSMPPNNMPPMPPMPPMPSMMQPSMNENIQPINLNNPIMTQSQVSNPTMSFETTTQPQVTMPMNTLSFNNPLNSLNEPSFLNQQMNTPEITQSQISQQKSSFKNTKASFKDIKNKMEKLSNSKNDEGNTDEESDDEDNTESFQNYTVESFEGSKVVESQHLRNMILAFIISFIALMTICSIYKLFSKMNKEKRFLLSWLVCFGIIFIFLEVSTYL